MRTDFLDLRVVVWGRISSILDWWYQDDFLQDKFNQSKPRSVYSVYFNNFEHILTTYSSNIQVNVCTKYIQYRRYTWKGEGEKRQVPSGFYQLPLIITTTFKFWQHLSVYLLYHISSHNQYSPWHLSRSTIYNIYKLSVCDWNEERQITLRYC